MERIPKYVTDPHRVGIKAPESGPSERSVDLGGVYKSNHICDRNSAPYLCAVQLVLWR